MTSGIDLILADHELVKQLFHQFESTGDGTIIGQIVAALIAHDEAEHGALYPMAGQILGDDGLLGAFDQAHWQVKSLIEHLASLEGDPLIATVLELRGAVEAHVQEEEKKLLPQLATAATGAQLAELAARIDHVKQRA